MAPVTIVTDTTHYLPRTLAESNDIHQVSLYYNWGEEPYREFDMPDFNVFYERLREGKEFPTTSQPSIGDYLAVYEPLLDKGSDILSIHFSSGISGTYATATQAKELLDERGGKGQIEVIDSQTACAGLAAVLLSAASASRTGQDLAGTAAHTRETRANLKLWFSIDTLEYLQRGGRIGKAQEWLGSSLKIKPILTITDQIRPVERVRTASRAFERMVDYLQSCKRDGADAWMVQHIQAPEQAQKLVERGREIFDSEPVFVSEIGPVIGAYTGPGLIGVGAIPSRFLLD